MSYDGVFLDNSTVRFERLLPGPIERVWDYLTKSEYLETWLAGVEGDWRPGGEIMLSFTFSAHDDCGDSSAAGVVQDYDPPRLLSYTWREVDSQGQEKPASIVRFELTPEGDKVRLILTHRKLSTAEMPGFGAGWDSHLHYLAARLGGKPVRPFIELFEPALAHYSISAKQ